MSIHNLEMKLINADLKLKRKTNVTYERLMQDVNYESDKKENMYMEIDLLCLDFLFQKTTYMEIVLFCVMRVWFNVEGEQSEFLGTWVSLIFVSFVTRASPFLVF